MQKILKNNYKLDLSRKVKIYLIFHILFLKLAKNIIRTNIRGKDDIKVNGLKEFQVEKIISKKRYNGKT